MKRIEMKCIMNTIVVGIVAIVLTMFLLFSQVTQNKQILDELRSQPEVQPEAQNNSVFREEIALDCLKELKKPMIQSLLRDAVVDTVEQFLTVLMQHLPHCAKYPPKKFISYFISILSETLDRIDRMEYDSPWTEKEQQDPTGTLSHLCPDMSPLLRGHIDIISQEIGEISDKNRSWNWPPTFEEIALEYQDQVTLGGFYKPASCQCRGYTALIVPFRDREKHLRYFLHYTHDLLWKQQLCYVIIVVEQGDDMTFNKGQLMNTGFYYARNISNEIDCFIFHDVDILAEDDRIIYTCKDGKVIHHVAPFINKYNYRWCCGVTVGAVVGFTKHQFENLNGFSNEYSGWGGEDDDMDARIKFKGYQVWRSYMNYTRFKMILHNKDKRNPNNGDRRLLIKNATQRQPHDGLNSLQTTIQSVVRHPTHTRLRVITSTVSKKLLP